MAINKVVYNTENGAKTLIDLTGDSVTPSTLAEGATAHDARGNEISGTMPTTTVLYTDQSLTDAQKSQARTNIGSASQGDIEQLLNEIDIVSDHKAEKDTGVFFIKGASGTAGTWTGTHPDITAYYDGLMIAYKVGVAGASTTTLNINGLGAVKVVRNATTAVSTVYPVNSVVFLVYTIDGSTAYWKAHDYDANTYQRVYETSTDNEYAITTRYNTTDGSTYYAEYGRYTNGVTINPSTNTITASKFKGALVGNADTATKATQDGNGNNIASTYETKANATEKYNELSNKIGNPPLVATSKEWLSANGDTSKQYVIPPSRDIYEYGTSVEGTANAVETAEMWDSTNVYYTNGYQNNKYLSIGTANAADNTSNAGGYTTTGFIPYDDVDGTFPTIYVKGIKWGGDNGNDAYCRIYFFTKSKGVEWGKNSVLGNLRGGNATLATYLTIETLADGSWSITPTSTFNNLGNNGDLTLKDTVGYFRICLKGDGANLNISVGTPISEGGIGWGTSGEQYVSVDSTINDRLWGKKVVFAGDSICQASTDEADKNGWAGRIGEKHAMTWTNKGVGGATLTSGVTGSAGCIANTDFGTSPDYIILEGGTNDADLIGGKDASGNMPAKYGSYNLYYYERDFDETTFCGAVESLFLRLTTDYAGAKIGFIIAHKMGGLSTNDGYFYDAENNKRRYYFETIIALCKKWGIPYIDLWEGCYLNPMNSKHNGGSDPFYNNGDYQHLTAKGYDYITPMIEKWMETL
jgi:lysophospholipase L1-like esterase